MSDVRLLRDVVEGQTTDRRAQLHVLVALASLALLLTGIGIYGLLAFMVSTALARDRCATRTRRRARGGLRAWW